MIMLSFYLNIICIVLFILTNKASDSDTIKKILTIIYLVISVIFVLIRLFIKYVYGIQFNLYFYNLNDYNFLFNFLNATNAGYLSDVLVLIAILVTVVSLWVLNEKALTLFSSNLPYFCIFILITHIMVYTNNILVMFTAYELLFIPTLYFSLVSTYTKNDDKAIRSILFWTLTGSVLILFCISYMYYIYKTLSITSLIAIKFTPTESNIMLLLTVLGFGVKVPISPLYYWITKIHVETSTGYSMFLSGFLVKTALYCLYFFLLILSNKCNLYWLSFFLVIGILEVSVRLWTQTDLKKIVAYSTIHEMSLILLLIVIKQNILSNFVVLFFFFHSMFSCLMFFNVDILQKRYKTRNIAAVTGSATRLPGLTKYIWIQILYFTGFPLTIKFYLEIQIFMTLYEYFYIACFCIVLITIFFVNISFLKFFLGVLYGVSKSKKIMVDVSESEINILLFIIFCLNLSVFLVFIF